jgi:hypothetical protein
MLGPTLRIGEHNCRQERRHRRVDLRHPSRLESRRLVGLHHASVARRKQFDAVGIDCGDYLAAQPPA